MATQKAKDKAKPTQSEPEEGAPLFSIASAGRIPVSMTLQLTNPKTGEPCNKPTRLFFVFRRRIGEEAQIDEREQTLRDKGQKMTAGELSEYNARRMARLLLEKPSGFADWPEKGDLRLEALEVFLNPDMERVVSYVVGVYVDATMPGDLFRALPLSGGKDATP